MGMSGAGRRGLMDFTEVANAGATLLWIRAGMHVFPAELIEKAAALPGVSAKAAQACGFLESCGYPGIANLLEALNDDVRELTLLRDAIGLDLKLVSCVYLIAGIEAEVAARGRAFLRNVRHGLYLVPSSIEMNIAIGCPVDPAFGLGGERLHNPYTEKLDTAARDGIDIDDEIWKQFVAAGER